MKKSLKIFSIIIFVILMAIGVFAYQQKENIKALTLSMNYSSDDIKNKLEANDLELEQIIKDKYNIDINLKDKNLNIGENALSKDTSDTSKDTNNEIADKDKSNKSDKSNKPSAKKPSTNKKQNVDTSALDELIVTSVNKIYELKALYLGKLANLESLVYTDYEALEESQRTVENKKNIVAKYYDYVSNLEKTCDTEVNAVLSNLKAELEKQKQSTEIIGSINGAYKKEKELKKAYYLKRLYE